MSSAAIRDRRAPRTGLALALALLAGCGGNDGGPRRSGASGGDEIALPAPAGTPGRGVTGMPDAPGPGAVGPPAEIASAADVDEFGNPVMTPDGGPLADDASGPLADDGGPLDGVPGEGMSGDPSTHAEPSPQDAVAVVRDYYGAINSGAYGRAYTLWSDGGRATGQSPQQFADGFAATAGVSVEILPPGRVDAGAGSRYIEVPVAITARQHDGSERRYVGAYTLRRVVVDGAPPEQRAWRITSADLREVRP